jgi:hypothetical protein
MAPLCAFIHQFHTRLLLRLNILSVKYSLHVSLIGVI